MDEQRQKVVRCAIYTRKSTEEGLEQPFNSLDAQRESAEAYIHSQRHLGWTIVERRFDDGGFSGGTLERPALQALLEEIEARQIDCVVVYKVDRLSRSLLDFARLMDRFERHSVSFVSVTQQFNTTTSLGRLTLNILLSFAQFEREIISERTRDKMSAARKKGKWVGGTPLLGYDVHPQGGRLVVNHSEAERVCEIFALYAKQRSLAAVVAELGRRGWTTKSWKSRRGVRHPGRAFTKASLRLLLSNPTYCGKVRYRGVIYEGEHAGIIAPEVWDQVNRDFQSRPEKLRTANQPQQAMLAGLLFCAACDQPMIATYAEKNGRRYRYYVCQSAREKGWKTCSTKSVSANLIESSLVLQLQARLTDALSDSERTALSQGDPATVRTRIEQIRYDGPSGSVSVRLRGGEGTPKPEPDVSFQYQLPRRRGRTLAGFRMRSAREVLTRPSRVARLLALAHKLEAQVHSGPVKDYAELARLAQITPARIAQIVILAQLAPVIQERILFLSPEHGAEISERELRAIAREPRWDRQLAQFEQLLAARIA